MSAAVVLDLGWGGETAPARLCSECEEPIPAKRLQAVPNAAQCVPCLEQMGDVPRVKRFDETLPTGDIVETLYTANPYIDERMDKLNHIPGSAYTDSELDQVTGNDAVAAQSASTLGESISEQRVAAQREED